MALIPVAEEAIELALTAIFTGDGWQREIALPEGITFRDQPRISVADAIKSFHLDAFLDYDGGLD